jgi:hypothetical protein
MFLILLVFAAALLLLALFVRASIRLRAHLAKQAEFAALREENEAAFQNTLAMLNQVRKERRARIRQSQPKPAISNPATSKPASVMPEESGPVAQMPATNPASLTPAKSVAHPAVSRDPMADLGTADSPSNQAEPSTPQHPLPRKSPKPKNGRRRISPIPPRVNPGELSVILRRPPLIQRCVSSLAVLVRPLLFFTRAITFLFFRRTPALPPMAPPLEPPQNRAA